MTARTPMNERQRDHAAPGPQLSALAIVLVVVTLLGSVAIPARLTVRVSELLGEITEVVEPARVEENRLRLGLAGEAALLQGYLLSGDTTQLARYRSLVALDEHRMIVLRRLAAPLADDLGKHIAHLERRIEGWRALHRSLVTGTGRNGAAAPLVAATYDSLFARSDGDSQLFALEASARREHIRALETLSLNVNAALVLVALAAVLAVVSLGRRERRLAAETRAGRQRLERAMQSRSRLMRGFSHDVKNPLGAADGYAAILAMGVHGDLAPGQRQSVDGIRRCIQSALRLIDDLHQLSRAETGNLVIDVRDVDIGAVVHASAEDFASAAAAKGLTLTAEVSAALPPVATDGARVREILNNLVSNAIKYTPRGGIALRAHGERSGSRDAVVIDVIDTGLGIPADKQATIFEEFSRLSTDQAGAGLGLAISKLLADALGAKMTVQSEQGHGSTFSLRLPASRQSTAQAGSLPEGHGSVLVTSETTG